MSTTRLSKRKAKEPSETVSGEDYSPTPFEQKAAAELLERRRNSPTSRLKLDNKSGGSFTVSFVHESAVVGDVVLMHSFGTANPCFVDAMLSQLGNLAVKGQGVDQEQLERMLSMAQAIRPKDEIEAMLAVQMAAIHQATMEAAKYLRGAQTLPQDAQSSNSLNKLARTFATQVEALKKHRATGEQSIKVQHVNVTGGQAIVGNVQTGRGGGVPTETEHQPHELDATALPGIAYAPGTPMFSNVEALRPALQGPGRDGLECVPMPRRQGRGS